jgi:hypothetical protein
MSYKESDIMHEAGDFFVLRQRNAYGRKTAEGKTRHDYNVYRIEGTHSVRCGVFTLPDEARALAMAIAECERRNA